MLYQEGISTSGSKQRVAVVVAHELAHQWFGNLVTPSWWTDLWLNEGFASYMEYIGMDAVEPTWKALEQFVVHDLQNVFSLDALESSHPISIEVSHPDEIGEIFDKISYDKGASIIRMMDHFLTTEVFKKGLTNYLNGKAYQSAEQNDLWYALTKQAHKDKVLDPSVTVKEIMDTWTLQTGFPVVIVSRNYNNGSITLIQERFLLRNSGTTTISVFEPLWWIPITYTSEKQLNFNNTRPIKWMKAERSIILNDLDVSSSQWVLFNVQETAHEIEYLPWKAAFNAMDYLNDMLIKTQGYDKFRLYILKLLDNVYKQVGFTDDMTDSQFTIFTRIEVLTWACNFDHEDCVMNAVQQFKYWRNTSDPDVNNPILPNLRSVVYCTAIRMGGHSEWEFAWQRYRRTNVGSEKNLLLQALTCTREIWLLSRLLDWTFTENLGIRKQDAAQAFKLIANNIVGRPLVFDYFRNNWEHLKEYFGKNTLSSINNIAKSAVTKISARDELKDLVEFIGEHLDEFDTATQTIQQAIEFAEFNIRWIDNNHATIHDWLQKNTM